MINKNSKTKTCLVCKIERPWKKFSKNISMVDGKQDVCRQCYLNLSADELKNYFNSIKELKCSDCKVIKPASFFTKNKRYPIGYSYSCKLCGDLYSFNKTDPNEERSKNTPVAEIKWYYDLKSKPCTDCKKTFDPWCMDFDHLRDKVDSVSAMVRHKAPMDRIMAEIAKCELVCILCHNKRTYLRQCALKRNLLENTTKLNIKRNIEIINNGKKVPCYVCKEQYEHYNMQYDHIDPKNKLENICSLKSCKVDFLLAEMAKCRVICSLCHRKKSYEEQNNKKYLCAGIKNTNIKKPRNEYKEGYSWCCRCYSSKEIERFSKSKTDSSKLNVWCMDCVEQYRELLDSKRKEYNFLLEEAERVKRPGSIEEGKNWCLRCNNVKESVCFTKSKVTESGLHSWCKGCINEYRRNKRRENK